MYKSLPLRVQAKRNSRRKNLTARRQSHMPADEVSHDAVSEDAKTPKKQLQCNNALRLYLADVLTSCLDSVVESEKILLKAIETTHGRIRLSYLQRQANYHSNNDSMDQQINECVAIGREENAHLDLEGIQHRKNSCACYSLGLSYEGIRLFQDEPRESSSEDQDLEGIQHRKTFLRMLQPGLIF